MKQLKITQSITNRSATVDKYLQEISRHPILTTEEEVTLARKIKAGDQAAIGQLTIANLRFVVSVAKQYQNNGLPLSDLISEGNFGLIKAAQRFDETRGFKFISYAVWWIRQTILQAMAEDARTIRLPLNISGRSMKLTRASVRFELEHEREPTDEELAEILKMEIEHVKNYQNVLKKPDSFDAPLTADDASSTLYEIIEADTPSPESKLMQESLRKQIDALTETMLSQREKEILEMFFGLNGRSCTLEEIGEKYDLTRERVRQIKEKALKLLRKGRSRRLLVEYR